MTKFRIAIFAASLITLTACGNASHPIVNSESAIPSATTSSVPEASKVSDDDSGVDCTELGIAGYPIITQQAALTIDELTYQVATVACASDEGEPSAEVIESFIQDSGVWASNGIASGPDIAFRTTGECASDGTQIQCPANVSSEDGADISGQIIITSEDSQPVWTFEPAS